MSIQYIPLIVCVLFFNAHANAQAKVLGECTIQFDIQQQQQNEWINIGTKQVWIKGNQCKTILSTPAFVQTLLFNILENKATVAKELGNNKYLQEIYYPPAMGATLISMKEVHTEPALILFGYTCRKIQLTWSDGVVYEVDYTSELIPSVKTFELAFKEIGGLVLAYSINNQKDPIIKFTANHLDFSPISMSQFFIKREEFQIIE